ncbi:hypothetical protein EB796_021875 [Bugula neritina]|uniref:Uncharacterized protein n=1 Tax=Bugula neritina TaxID=10212 RepID=A0A7J7J269_BUGNE|nr:hypothetical protein EB796_021875 [Bugula neritina]
MSRILKNACLFSCLFVIGYEFMFHSLSSFGNTLVFLRNNTTFSFEDRKIKRTIRNMWKKGQQDHKYNLDQAIGGRCTMHVNSTDVWN